jgi:hypothetical protein
MTPEAIEVLFHLALERCGEDKEVFGVRVKRALGLSVDAQITKKSVGQQMRPEQYKTLYAYCETLYSQLQRRTEVTHHGPATTPQTSTQPAPAPTGEDPPAVPSSAASSSAPEPSPDDAAARNRARLRKEVASWDLRVSQAEIEYILTHHPYSKARTLLWKARRPASNAMPMEAAAD